MFTILSYPRSGQHWARYILEQYNIDFKYTHEVKDVSDDCSLIFLLRNYKECIIRNHLQGFDIHDIMLPKLPYETREQLWLMLGVCFQDSYMLDLQTYDKFVGKKTLVYYEDLIGEPHVAIRKLLEFADATCDSGFFSRLEDHAQNSISRYPARSFTQGKKVLHHSVGLPSAIEALWDRTMMNADQNLYDKYLQRYHGHKNVSAEPSVNEWRITANLLSSDDQKPFVVFEDN